VTSGQLTAIALDPSIGAALVAADGSVRRFTPHELADGLAAVECDLAPRWVWWSIDTARALVELGVRPRRCWDVSAVHRLLHGGWRAEPARIWASSQGLDTSTIPEARPIDLFTTVDDTVDDDPAVRDDGHLRPDWLDAGRVAGTWRANDDHLVRHARLALAVSRRQADQLAALVDRPAAATTALSESAADALCAELEHDGLPIDVDAAERIIAGFIGPRPTSAHDELQRLAERDDRVLHHLPSSGASGHGIDLRNPASVKSLLRRVGIEVQDTRAWRLEQLRDRHPIVEELLAWRRAERIATTFGYRWLDEHVAGGRLRGQWAGADGAAGRMTATAGLHNMPAELRPAIVADPGHVFIRSDLGQIEPRVLAAVSGDAALAAAATEADLYAPVAARLGVERDIAKVAVLGAMYGQTTGTGAAALRGLERAYPTAMGFLEAADHTAQAGRDLRTVGGRLVQFGSTASDAGEGTVNERDVRNRTAARGRFGRNAMVQGAAAELFKTWAGTVRAELRRSGGGSIVLCLHDELLVHAPSESAAETAELVDDALGAAAQRWCRRAEVDVDVTFIADTTVIRRWSDAK